MDEPTNDLDAETLDLLEELVAEYSGTLLLVSHDRAFLDNVVTSTLVFEGEGRVNEYVGGYSDWLRQRRAPSAKAKSAIPRATPAPPPKARKLSYRDQRELEAMPATIQRLEAEQAELQSTIGDPELFRRNPADATAAMQRLQAVQDELENAFSRWEALEASAKP